MSARQSVREWFWTLMSFIVNDGATWAELRAKTKRLIHR